MDTFLSILNSVVSEAIAPDTAAVAIAVIGLNIHFGFTGLLNIGQAGYMLLGAYGMAISITHDIPLALAVLIGLVISLIFSLILGLPTLKLRGDYLAIVTISAAEIIRYTGRLAAFEDFTGGSQGIFGKSYQGPFISLSFLGDGSTTLLPLNYREAGGTGARIAGLLVALAALAAIVWVAKRMKSRGSDEPTVGTSATPKLLLAVLSVVMVLALFFSFPQSEPNTSVDGWWVRLVAWGLVGLSCLIVFLLVRSPWGRLLRGIREDEDAIRSLGKNVFAIKMQALIIGGMFGALGGMVYVLTGSVQADSMGRQLTFFAYTALLLGGAATIFGPVLGAIIFFSARILVREMSGAYVPNSIMSDQQTEQFSYIVVGIVLVLLVIFRPQGILGNKRELRFHV
ncbi:branched-chain amino acid ABC transporter permease [Nocardioides ferulae]|uniref:branched-chain amino acid ABC transporter permease n=1 Tax=Nocardioides ferulae TaxID=2340821 RepID=UPI000EABD9BB|nr:branched-chain amino acid ABC transporter permease [Nocardioides ferulae]